MEYKQIPKMVNGKCSVCKQTLNHKKSENIYIYDTHMNYKMAVATLYHCSSCAVSYADSEIFTDIRLKNKGFRASGYILSTKKEKLDVLKKRIQTFPIGTGMDVEIAEKMESEIEHPHEGFISRPIDRYEKINRIYIANDFEDKCVICDRLLVKRELCIPISKERAVFYTSKCCGSHFLTHPSRKLQGLIKENPYAKHISIDYTYYFRCYKDASVKYQESDDNVMIFYMKSMGRGHKELALIIGNSSEIISENIHILDYKDYETRKLLVDLVRNHKKLITYQKEKYELRYKESKGLSEDILLESIKIKAGGGYWSSINGKRYQMVDALMYSPFTNNYELIHATYDNDEYECFMDISVFRSFIAKYGNPGIKIHTDRYKGIDSDFLNDESILHVFGYSVNQKDNLSRVERQEILAEVIDLEIMQIPAVIRLLTGCRDRAKGNGYYEACAKYEDDIKFVTNYKFNPERFLILSI